MWHMLWHAACLSDGVAMKAGRHTLKITIHETDKSIELTLEGRVTGPWVAELNRVWEETAPQLGKKSLSIDLRNVIYADAGGKQILRDIYSQTRAKLIANSPWAQYLAQEIMHSQPQAC